MITPRNAGFEGISDVQKSDVWQAQTIDSLQDVATAIFLYIFFLFFFSSKMIELETY